VTEDQYPALIKKKYKENADKVLAVYPLNNHGSASEALSAVDHDSGRVCTELKISRALSKFVPVFMYEFADRTMPSYLAPVTFPLGAYHTGEIQYLFPLYRGATGKAQALNPLQEKLSDMMVSYWATFAKSGTPNSQATPNWPQLAAQDEKYQSLKLPEPVALPVSLFSAAHKCDFWDSLK
jgi:para-nitrobenzyl esterase